MGRLKEAWLAAVEEGREDQFLNSFPELDEEDKYRLKNLLGLYELYGKKIQSHQEAIQEGMDDGESESVSNQGS